MAEVDPARARAEARAILAGDRYQERDLPRPFEGVLHWIGERVQDLGRPVGDLLATPLGAAAALGGAVLVTVVLVALTIRRRTRLAAAEAERQVVAAGGVDPRALDREAEAAEAAGDLAGAVRLRFRAGVVRLGHAGLTSARRAATTGRLVATVPSSALPPLARAFDEIAYGGRPAGTDDVSAAREGWPRVLADVVAARAHAGAEEAP